MQVFLVRHAEAVPETIELRDPHRPLTPHGRTQARALGERMRWYDCGPTHIWSSPLVRAVQTAELLAIGMESSIGVEIVPALAPPDPLDATPDGDPRHVVDTLRKLGASAAVMIVGHEPSLSAIGALVVGDPNFPALTKAQAVRIVDGTVRWRFSWDAEAPEKDG